MQRDLVRRGPIVTARPPPVPLPCTNRSGVVYLPMQNDSYHNLFNHLYDGLYFVDRDRRITFWNRAAEEITGHRSEDVLHFRCRDNILNHVDAQGNSLCLTACPLTKAMEGDTISEDEIFLHHKNGHRIPVSVRAIPLKDEEGRITGAAEMFTEITPKQALETRVRELEKLALLDGLTQLSNRRHLEMELAARLQEVQRYDLSVGILFFDIDRFKRINDTYGHEQGDHVLRGLARTLLSIARPFDVYGRYGGEEFVGIIRNVDLEGLEVVAERVRKMVAHTSYRFDQKIEHVTVSVGATLLRSDDTVPGALERADHLMYQSKQDGRNRTTTG
ncbi:MAG: diguanylate cyclase [Candidatus Neomarinimicrobiota bacterium]|nr:MAG: diguanylate cyclase [Candidatus Neomarinimicrobiota bacterium]